ncbi:MAG: PE family protein [Mycobacterium sp.]
MSLVIAAPELMADTAMDLANIGSTLNAAHMTAASPTAAVVPAAADEVSVSIANLFSLHAQDYQALAGQAAAFHEQFVQHLTSSAASYASAEAANATLLQPLAASAGSFASAIADFGNQLGDLFNAILSQLPGLFVTLGEALPVILPIIALPLIVVGLLGLLLLFVIFLLAAAGG